jgi:hypothetical protein
LDFKKTSFNIAYFFPFRTSNRVNGTGVPDVFGPPFLETTSDFQLDFDAVMSLKHLAANIASLARSIHPKEE